VQATLEGKLAQEVRHFTIQTTTLKATFCGLAQSLYVCHFVW